MKRTTLGGLDVSAQGLGCMGMSEYYGASDWDTSVATIRHGIDVGITLFDTADQYGSGHNEVLVGRGIAGRRDSVQIATKFGIDRSSGDQMRVHRGDPPYVKRSCDSSLLRLGVDHIDLFSLHRPPQNAEIEDTVGAMAELVGVLPAQVALAWVYAQAPRLGIAVVPIPGTRHANRLDQNVASLDIELDTDALTQLQPLSDLVTGGRYADHGVR